MLTSMGAGAQRDPQTGKEFDGAFDDALEASERQRRLAEDRASAAQNQLTAASDELSVSQERIRELEQRLRDSTGQTRPIGQDS